LLLNSHEYTELYYASMIAGIVIGSTDFVDGIVTLGGNGDPAMQVGVAIHIYACNASMEGKKR
jgi:homogentisate 1,2-dioxygenase